MNKGDIIFGNSRISITQAILFYRCAWILAFFFTLNCVFADDFEPDNNFSGAVEMPIPGRQLRVIDFAGDEDWVRFYAVSGITLDVTGVHAGNNAQIKVEVYQYTMAGELIFVNGDQAGSIGYMNELTGRAGVSLYTYNGTHTAGVYMAKFSHVNPNTFGADTAYTIFIEASSGLSTPGLIVTANNNLSRGALPPGSRMKIDNGEWTNFNGATSLSFANLSPGTYTIRIEAPSGFWPDEDPFLAGSVSNMNSPMYGNPRLVTVTNNKLSTPQFLFMPICTAQGEVKDSYTGEWLADAGISFKSSSGPFSGLIYSKYPNFANYANPWKTGPNGEFPSNVFLPTGSWHLVLSKGGYITNVVTNAIVNQSVNTTNQLGVRKLSPIDLNTNGIRDSWETNYFGGFISSTNDPDLDGVDNRGEYLAGTNPTNSASVLKSGFLIPGDEALNLTWPVVGGRSYQVVVNSHLSTGVWSTIFGPHTASPMQSIMSYSETNILLQGRSYRIEVVPP